MPVDKTKQTEVLQGNKVPKNSIPSDGDTIVKSLIYDVGYTKTAYTNAQLDNRDPNLFDGIYIKFLHLEYFAGKEHRLLVSTKGDKVEFPCDITAPDGNKVYCYITNEIYLTPKRLTSKSIYGGFTLPNNLANLLTLYDHSLCMELGVDPGVLVDTMLSIDNLLKDVSDSDLNRVGITKPEIKQFPVLSLYRYHESYVDKKTGKKQSNWKLSGYNKTTKQVDLGGSKGIEWLPESETLRIWDAVTERDIEKQMAKKASESFKPTSSEQLEKDAGF